MGMHRASLSLGNCQHSIICERWQIMTMASAADIDQHSYPGTLRLRSQ